jgi:hypothetical protein
MREVIEPKKRHRVPRYRLSEFDRTLGADIFL